MAMRFLKRSAVFLRPHVQLLDVIEDNDFKGKVSLLYTRRPSPTASLARDGAEVDIMVTEKQLEI